jgi:hypothetical protein
VDDCLDLLGLQGRIGIARLGRSAVAAEAIPQMSAKLTDSRLTRIIIS